jgi:hypothetical protein
MSSRTWMGCAAFFERGNDLGMLLFNDAAQPAEL